MNFPENERLEAEVEACAHAHAEAARAYERRGNAAGAAELRRVENLLWCLVQGHPWETVLRAERPVFPQDRLDEMVAKLELDKAISELKP